jgi:hypothetical protein
MMRHLGGVHADEERAGYSGAPTLRPGCELEVVRHVARGVAQILDGDLGSLAPARHSDALADEKLRPSPSRSMLARRHRLAA